MSKENYTKIIFYIFRAKRLEIIFQYQFFVIFKKLKENQSKTIKILNKNNN